MSKRLFTSESVTEGHPDKICDQISDAILDEILKEDPMARVACETTCTTGIISIMGEITTSCYVDFPKVARQVVLDIGYDRAKYGFDGTTCAVVTAIDEQSPDIAQGVNDGYENREQGGNDNENSTGAGDQGMMFGYACDETPEFMPMPISLAHKMAKKLTQVRKDGILDYLRPDGKTQVTVEYDDDKPVRVDAVVVSSQHSPDVDIQKLREDIKREVILTTVPAELIDENTKFYINPTGRFVVGGPNGDSGLTGRKLIVDTYGGYARHGGGAFSGKDPTKVDRSAAYASRWVAKNVVAAGLAKKCEVQLAYAIGVAHPVSIMVDTFGTATVDEDKIEQAIEKVFDLRPHAIIKQLDLRKPIYKNLAAYGHMGREDLGVSWEKLDKVEELKEDIAQISDKLDGADVREQVRKINGQITACTKIISARKDEQKRLLIRQGQCEEEKKQKENRRSELSLLDKNNQKIELYKAYTQQIYDELLAEYKEKEKNVRERLERSINEIFKSIYDGGLSLSIDEKYNISVYVTDFEGGVETSTAQSISVIFAFISAIIKMARDNQVENGDEAYSEPYPLVMDAPLSAFDKRRIKAICSAIPETAEQVIIFIKDTDGELAEDYLGTRVMKRHYFEKVDEFNTHLR